MTAEKPFGAPKGFARLPQQKYLLTTGLTDLPHLPLTNYRPKQSMPGIPPGPLLCPMLTQGNVPRVLPFYVPEEIPLGRVQGPPFFPGEIKGNVSKCHRSLE